MKMGAWSKRAAEALQKYQYVLLVALAGVVLLLWPSGGGETAAQAPPAAVADPFQTATLERRLDEVNITANKNAVPGDPEKPTVTSGLRLGTPPATTRGFKEAEMAVIAKCIALAVRDFEAQAENIRAQVAELTGKYPLYEG